MHVSIEGYGFFFVLIFFFLLSEILETRTLIQRVIQTLDSLLFI